MYECMMEEMNDESVSIVSVCFMVTEPDGEMRVMGAQRRQKLTKEEAFMNIFEKNELFPSSVNKLYRRYLFDNLRLFLLINNAFLYSGGTPSTGRTRKYLSRASIHA